MVMKLENIVPFGRSLDEYKNMFSLYDGDLGKNIIGVGDGPASFNAEMFALGFERQPNIAFQMTPWDKRTVS